MANGRMGILQTLFPILADFQGGSRVGNREVATPGFHIPEPRFLSQSKGMEMLGSRKPIQEASAMTQTIESLRRSQHRLRLGLLAATGVLAFTFMGGMQDEEDVSYVSITATLSNIASHNVLYRLRSDGVIDRRLVMNEGYGGEGALTVRDGWRRLR